MIKWIRNKWNNHYLEVCVIIIGIEWMFCIRQSMSVECEKAKIDISQTLLNEVRKDSK